MDDLAVFRASAIDSTMDQDQKLVDIVSEPRLFCSYLAKPDEATLEKGTACMCITDRSAQEILKKEAAQLPIDQPGIVLLDLSGMIGSYSEWQDLIQRRLQPRINTRISGVLLFQVRNGLGRRQTEGSLIINKYAKNPLPSSAIQLLESLIKTQ